MMETDKRDEALLEDIAQYFEILARDSEEMVRRGLQKRDSTIRASVWRQAADDVRAVELVEAQQ